MTSSSPTTRQKRTFSDAQMRQAAEGHFHCPDCGNGTWYPVHRGRFFFVICGRCLHSFLVSQTWLARMEGWIHREKDRPVGCLPAAWVTGLESCPSSSQTGLLREHAVPPPARPTHESSILLRDPLRDSSSTRTWNLPLAGRVWSLEPPTGDQPPLVMHQVLPRTPGSHHPSPSSSGSGASPWRPAALLYRRLLLRGLPTRLSPAMEALLLSEFHPRQEFRLESQAGSFRICQGKTSPLPQPPSPPHPPAPPLPGEWAAHPRFDSEAERTFYGRVLPQVLGPEFARHTFPQVPLRALSPSQEKATPSLPEGLEERLDFLITSPRLARPLAVEIDGPHHRERVQHADDAHRDALLHEWGISTLRIPLPCPEDRQVTLLRQALAREEARHPASGSILHRLATSILALQYAAACAVTDLPAGEAATWTLGVHTLLPDRVARAALEEARTAIRHLAALCGDGIPDLPPWEVHIARSAGDLPKADVALLVRPDQPSILLDPGIAASQVGSPLLAVTAEYHPWRAALPAREAELTLPPVSLFGPEQQQALLFCLQWLFWKENFREHQLEGIRFALQGRDSVVLLPTGSGKSLIYQMAGLLRPGTALCLSPLVSLVQDQIRGLMECHGVTRAFGFSSDQTQEEKSRGESLLVSGELYFAFLTPERLQTDRFCDLLTRGPGVSLVAVDEAHVVSEWGHDFRPAYLRILQVLIRLFESRRPPIMALTATAARNVLRDIQRQLRILDPAAVLSPVSFDRPELTFFIHRVPAGSGSCRLPSILRELPASLGKDPKDFWTLKGEDTCSGLIFIPTVNGSNGILETHDRLESILRSLAPRPLPVGFYCGQYPKNMNTHEDKWGEIKASMARSFIGNRLHTMVATNAFGMGIDKPNIRFTIHQGLPASIEAFYQEAGRAGRDRKPSVCHLVFSGDTESMPDLNVPDWYLSDKRKDDFGTDLGTQAFFLKSSFPGIGEELKSLKHVLDDVHAKRGKPIHWVQNGKSCPATHSQPGFAGKTLQYLFAILERLGILHSVTAQYKGGLDLHLNAEVSEDWTAPRVADAFEALERLYDPLQAETMGRRIRQLPERPHPEEIYRIWLENKYATILKGRLRSLRELTYLARDETSNSEFRKALERYLGETIFSTRLDELIQKGEREFGPFLDLGRNIHPAEWRELGRQAGRLLEAAPNNAGLLLLRALSRALEGDVEEATQELAAASRAWILTHPAQGARVRQELCQALSRVNALPMVAFVLNTRAELEEGERRAILEAMDDVEGLPALAVAERLSEAAYEMRCGEIARRIKLHIEEEFL